MGKTRRKVDKRAEEVASSSVSHDEIIENRRRESKFRVFGFELLNTEYFNITKISVPWHERSLIQLSGQSL